MKKLTYNKNLLHEDVKFPLSWGCETYKMYVFDNEMNMIAQVDLDTFPDPIVIEHPFTKLLGDYKEFEDSNKEYLLSNGDFISYKEGKIIGCVRGWGRLQKLKSPKGEKRQDNIANYILNIINNQI